MFVKIIRHSRSECLITEILVEHSNHGGTLCIADVVEDLVHVIWMSNCHFDRMRIVQGVQVEGRAKSSRDELRPDVVLGKQMIDAEIL